MFGMLDPSRLPHSGDIFGTDGEPNQKNISTAAPVHNLRRRDWGFLPDVPHRELNQLVGGALRLCRRYSRCDRKQYFYIHHSFEHLLMTTYLARHLT
jgi:hypothetical protein